MKKPIFKLKIYPPLVTLLCALLMWTIANWTKQSFSFSGQLLLTGAVLLLASIVILNALYLFHRAKTTVHPFTPEHTNSLVQTGIYAYSRNPMYLGFLLILLAVGCYLGSVMSLFVLPVFVGYITYFQILPEEQVLNDKLGQEFTNYQKKVRRWL